MSDTGLHRVWRVGADIDTDALAPGHAMKHGIETIARHCLEAVRPEFAGELFVKGGLLDATRYFIILPDGIGHGQTSKPSDGLRARFVEEGVFIRPFGSIVYLTPPFTIEHEELAQLTRAVVKVVAEMGT